jgi:hypothetical protein
MKFIVSIKVIACLVISPILVISPKLAEAEISSSYLSGQDRQPERNSACLSWSKVAQAARKEDKQNSSHVARLAAQRKLYRNYLVIRFPWRRCTVWYTARVPYPPYIVGYACGTYVVCRRTSGRNYVCRY